jgi:type IV pilus assembly protein PilA
MRKNAKGFSWLEIIIVIVIIVLTAGILVPSLWKSKSQIDETSAVRSLRTIIAAQNNYAQAYNTGYSSALTTLGPPPDAMPTAAMAGFIDSELASGQKEGYSFIYTAGPQDENGRIASYTLQANPVKPGETGKTFYYVDQTGLIHTNTQRPAGPNDAPIGG